MSLGYVGDNPAVFFGEKDVSIATTSDKDKVWVGLRLDQLKYPIEDRIPCEDDLEEGCSSLYILFKDEDSLNKVMNSLDKVREQLISWELEKKEISDDYCDECDIKR